MKITTSLLGYLIRLYDKEEISLSRLAEMVNEKAELNWTPTTQMPNYDGDYLCHIEKKEVCSTINYYQRVINCCFNKWVIQDGETVTHWQHLPQNPNSQESNVSSQEPSIEDFRDQVLKVICENRDAIIRASNDRMTALEVFETKNCFAAVINTYEDLFEIITVLKPNGDQTAQEPDATASKEIGEPPVQNKSNQ